MKVLYVTTISNTVNSFLIPHIKMLINQGHQVDVAFNIVQEVKQEIFEMGCKVHNIEFQRVPWNRKNISAYKKIKKLIKKEKYDLVHTHTPTASAYVRLACRNMNNIIVIYTAHGFHFYKGAPIKNWLIYYPIEKWLSKYTDVLITINNEDYERAKKFRAKSVYYVPGVGVDLTKFKPQTIEKKLELRRVYGFKENDFILIFVAELNKNKHQDLLIKVISNLKIEMPNIKLILAGVGDSLEGYKKLAETLNVKENVQFLGYRNDIHKLLLLSDIAVSSSRREGLPVNVMEAMAVGLPLVVTDCRGNRDLVQHENNGFIVEIDNIAMFSKYIKKIYESEYYREHFHNMNLRNIKMYSIDNVLREMKKLTCEIYDE